MKTVILAILLSFFTLPCLAQDLDKTTLYGQWAGEKSVVSITVSNGVLNGTLKIVKYPADLYELKGKVTKDWAFEVEVIPPRGPGERWKGGFEFGHITVMKGSWFNDTYGSSGPIRFVDDTEFSGD